MRVALVVERAVGEVRFRQRLSDNDQCGPRKLMLANCGPKLAKRRSNYQLVRPSDPIRDRRGAFLSVMRNKLPLDFRCVPDGEMDGKRSAGPTELFKVFAGRHFRRFHGGSRQDHRLSDAGDGKFLAERGCGCGEGRDAGNDLVLDAV